MNSEGELLQEDYKIVILFTGHIHPTFIYVMYSVSRYADPAYGKRGDSVATKVAHIREATSIPILSAPSSEALYRITKRLLDIVVASVLLVLFAPLMAVIALAIVLDTPGPVIFRQKRVLGEQKLGEDDPTQHVFTFMKFRTMIHNADQSVHRKYMENLINGRCEASQVSGKKIFKLGKDPRITRVGRILRKTSLDELPQLINVLRGEMSLVGPRPAIPYEVSQYKAWHMPRLTVKQGLTGLWQIAGRNELSFDEMVQCDIEYVRHRSLLLDLKILLLTIPAVISGRGAN